jgi:hypothetical protein
MYSSATYAINLDTKKVNEKVRCFPFSSKKDKKILISLRGRKIKNTEKCGLALYAKNQENQWYIDNGCNKHMPRDKSKFEILTEVKIGNVTFGNNAPAKISGK